jgi:glutathione S-transferase
MFRGSLETFSVPGAAIAARWIAVREALEPFARAADALGASDAFLLGEQETYVDVVAVCWLGWARWMWGADTQEWADMAGVGTAHACMHLIYGSTWIPHPQNVPSASF